MQTQPYTSDTSDHAEQQQLELFRRLTPTERIQKVCRLSSSLRQMAMDSIRRHFPEISDHECQIKFIEITYGPELSVAVEQFIEARVQGRRLYQPRETLRSANNVTRAAKLAE